MEHARSNGSFERTEGMSGPDRWKQRYSQLEHNSNAQGQAFQAFEKNVKEYQNPLDQANPTGQPSQTRLDERNRLAACSFGGDPVIGRVQASLVQAGYNLGHSGHKGVDGINGPLTSKAIAEFQKANHLEPTGKPDQETMRMLDLTTERGLTKKDLETIGDKAAQETDPLRQKPQQVILVNELSPDAQQRLINRDELASHVQNGNAYIAKSQASLQMAGYELGKSGIDGIAGPDTSKAVMDYQKDKGLNPTGKLDIETMISLNNSTAEGWKRSGLETKPETESVSPIKPGQDTVMTNDNEINPTGQPSAEKTNTPGQAAVAPQPVQETGKKNQPAQGSEHHSNSNSGLGKNSSRHYVTSYDKTAVLTRANPTALPKNSVVYDQVKASQNQLQQMGFDIGPKGADGKFGNDTKQAVRDFQTATHLPVTGELDKATVERMMSEFKKGMVVHRVDVGTAEKERKTELQKSSGNYNYYLKKLANFESHGQDNDGYGAKNSIGYLGKYQMGEAALHDMGFYNDSDYTKNDWKGTWTDLAKSYGVTSKETFLNNPKAQEYVIREYQKKEWEYIHTLGLDDSKKYIGQEVQGVKITASGLLAGAHLVGIGGLKQFLTGKPVPGVNVNSQGIPIDGNGTPITAYIKNMGGCNLQGLLGYNPDIEQQQSKNTNNHNIKQEPGNNITLKADLKNDNKRAQSYLSKLGFNIGKDKDGKFLIDGQRGCLTASSLILFQYKMDLKLTGEVNNETLAALKTCTENGMKYDDIMNKQGRELPVIKKDYSINGRIDSFAVISIPSAENKPAWLPEKTAVSWAYMVQEAYRDPKVNINCLKLEGDISGYRSLENQKECLKIYGPSQAAEPGKSPHGWGLAIDFNVSNPGKHGVPAGSYEVEWLEKNASRFGFYPYLVKGNDHKKQHFPDGTNKYEENWHWNYNPEFIIK